MALGPESSIDVGTVLVCWKDCGYLKVDEVKPDGIICKSAFGPHLYTWQDLEYLRAAVHSIPGSAGHAAARAQARPPRLVARGGRVDLSGKLPSIDTSGPDRDARTLDQELIRRLIGHAKADWEEITVNVDGVEFTIERVDAVTASYEARLRQPA